MRLVKQAVRQVLVVAASMLMPGVSLIMSRPLVAVALLGCDIAALMCARDVLVDPWNLLVDDAAWREAVLYGMWWVIAGLTTLFIYVLDERTLEGGLPRWRTIKLAVFSTAAIAPVVALSVLVVPNIRAVRDVFVNAPAANPTGDGVLALPGARLMPGEKQKHGRVNILLLGGDAGPRRWGLRTDAMHVVSIDLDTQKAAVISIPRNLGRAPMPAGLAKQFPRGFTNLANAVYGWGEQHPAEVSAALGATDAPGATLTAAMIAEFTGLRIDAWVVVDMQGFLEIVDAFGGVDVWVKQILKTPGNVPGGKHPLRDFTPGWHHMDGTDALGYTRSRKSDSDYHRMTRQRCVLASLAAQTDATELAWRWSAIADVLSSSVRTNLTPELMNALRGLVGADVSYTKVLSLNPPLVPEYSWDAASVRALVASVIEGKPRAPLVMPQVAGSPYLSVTTTVPVPVGAASADDEVQDQCRTKP